jgi:hypothetical protein
MQVASDSLVRGARYSGWMTRLAQQHTPTLRRAVNLLES